MAGSQTLASRHVSPFSDGDAMTRSDSLVRPVRPLILYYVCLLLARTSGRCRSPSGRRLDTTSAPAILIVTTGLQRRLLSRVVWDTTQVMVQHLADGWTHSRASKPLLSSDLKALLLELARARLFFIFFFGDFGLCAIYCTTTRLPACTCILSHRVPPEGRMRHHGHRPD